MQTNKSGVKVRQHHHAKSSTFSRDDTSISNSEYERGTRIAGWMFCAMLAFMAAWTVISSWC